MNLSFPAIESKAIAMSMMNEEIHVRKLQSLHTSKIETAECAKINTRNMYTYFSVLFDKICIMVEIPSFMKVAC